MTERKLDQTSIVDELKELGRQLTATLKAIAGSDQVRSLGVELKDGLREAAENVEETWDKLRERDELQRLQARAADVAESFKSGAAQQELRAEVLDALRALNLRLRAVVERFETPPHGAALVPPPKSLELEAPGEKAYTGVTQKLEA